MLNLLLRDIWPQIDIFLEYMNVGIVLVLAA